MQRNSLYLFTLFGVPIRVHVTWLIIFVLITWSLAAAYFPSEYKGWPPGLYWIVGFVTSILFFVSVVLHELAHSVVAKARGMKVRDIVLFIFGGVSELEGEPGSAPTEFLMAMVGPLTSFVIGLVSLEIWSLTKAVHPAASAAAFYLFWINMLLGVFNLIPGFPLDGGRLLRALLWGATGDLKRATRWATRVGSLVAYGLIFIGIWQAMSGRFVNGLWLAFIGWFLYNAAQSGYSNLVVKDVLASRTVGELVNRDYPTVQMDLSLEALVHDHILGQGRRSLPVMLDGRYAGLVTVHNVQSVPREKWPVSRVADVMIPAERVYSISTGDSLWDALQQMTQEGVHQLAVTDNGQFVGILARDAILGFLKVHAELGG
jgi:Zn-dependent protease